MDSSFRFKQFSVSNVRSALKVGTDAVLLGAAVTLLPEDQYALDLGTGTGVIALMVAQRSPQLQITGIDIDEDSALEAAENFANSPWAERLTALHQDALNFRPEHSFDLIVSNPPYFESSLKTLISVKLQPDITTRYLLTASAVLPASSSTSKVACL